MDWGPEPRFLCLGFTVFTAVPGAVEMFSFLFTEGLLFLWGDVDRSFKKRLTRGGGGVGVIL